ncbi:MAG: AIPR family protein [Desulfohalobiaceae bacterium]|nr:AIPR family protein [Desulfohalobiaceae bacterium]
MIHQYNMLITVIDRLRKEAPSEYKKYYPQEEDYENLNKARSLTFIHLLLKVKFGLVKFRQRERLITDGPYDGGVDGYFIDENNKKLYLIQSKFRTSAKNFENKSIDAEDLLKMEIGRITKGEICDSKGNEFNEKIKSLQEKLKSIRDIAKYDYIVLFLGNVFKHSDEQIRRMIENCEYIIYDSCKAYKDLLFPLATGTYYDPDEITISLDLNQKESTRLKQSIDTEFGQYNVTVLFVPTEEIAKIMMKYKNAILKYNPRNFLSLKSGNVNDNIRKSITSQQKNNFAIINNGITLLSDNISITESTGTHNTGQLILNKPQILNGGQTAYTLSSIYEKYRKYQSNPLKDKEVLLKVITPMTEDDTFSTDFIQLISNATNQQNVVNEADRRSNHSIQIQLQKIIFEEYGYFYERKAGEFHDGVNEGLIDKNLIIDRLTFIKSFLSYLGKPAKAKRSNQKTLFKENFFNSTINDIERYKEMFFSYIIYTILDEYEQKYANNFDSIKHYGYALVYGKFAVVASISHTISQIENDLSDLIEQARSYVDKHLSIWPNFEEFVKNWRKDLKYFNESRSDFQSYYKVDYLDEDVVLYFVLNEEFLETQ